MRVRFSGKDRTVTDGPFAETKELLAGFWLWRVESMDEAIEWVKRCPNPMPGESEIEIRPSSSRRTSRRATQRASSVPRSNGSGRGDGVRRGAGREGGDFERSSRKEVIA